MALAIALSLPAAARGQDASQEEGRPGVDLGARVGYAIPFGLSNTFSSAVPFVFEVGYRLEVPLTLGGLFKYGIAQVKDDFGCGNDGTSCSGSIVSFGIEAIYHFPLDSPYGPWIGLGTGYEWMRINLSGNNSNTTAQARGFEFVTVQTGVDVKAKWPLSLGPFVSFSVGRYGSVSEETGSATPQPGPVDTAVHGWLQFGLRGRLSR
jgi:hypothetical protein